jgi:hypothetical protein
MQRIRELHLNYGNSFWENEYRESTRLIDKIYGLLGLAADQDDGTSPAMLVEADIDKEPYEVFWDVLLECRAPPDKLCGVKCSLIKMLAPGNSRVSPWSLSDHEAPRVISFTPKNVIKTCGICQACSQDTLCADSPL